MAAVEKNKFSESAYALRFQAQNTPSKGNFPREISIFLGLPLSQSELLMQKPHRNWQPLQMLACYQDVCHGRLYIINHTFNRRAVVRSECGVNPGDIMALRVP